MLKKYQVLERSNGSWSVGIATVTSRIYFHSLEQFDTAAEAQELADELNEGEASE